MINAAGPWVDQCSTESNTSGPRLIGGTKGSHIIVAPFPALLELQSTSKLKLTAGHSSSSPGTANI